MTSLLSESNYHVHAGRRRLSTMRVLAGFIFGGVIVAVVLGSVFLVVEGG